MQWDNPDDLTGAPDNTYTNVFDDSALPSEINDRWPDIAYTPDDGDIYLTYCEDLGFSEVKLKYRKFTRGVSWSSAFEVDRMRITEGGPEYHTWNMHIPRIDVGYLDGFFNEWDDDVLGVAITYTAEFCDVWDPPWDPQSNRFHVHVFCWDEAIANGIKYDNKILPDDIYSICLRNPVGISGEGNYVAPDLSTWNHNAGEPYIDIAPMGNTESDGVITFIQLEGWDLYGPILAIWQINSLTMEFESCMCDYGTLADGLYPSIAWHYDENYASLTYFRQERETNIYYPYVIKVNMSNGSPVTASDQEIDNLFCSTGSYNTEQIPFCYPGATSAISVTDDNKYWAAWADRIVMEYPPEEIWAAWGFIGS